MVWFAGFGVGGAENYFGNPRPDYRAGAHRARLYGNKQLAAGQTIIIQFSGCGAQGYYFSVGGGIVSGNAAVMAPGDDDIV
ncbi:MAG: hypothetical protein A2219_02760 [Elusimicrobia bacterium RIFOXYA2_FULL_50_26]|nr:MAG: hypothetical protein A2219_02760 [Elusimicrobia bacterium RIFOXYA2_FULL_50_26]